MGTASPGIQLRLADDCGKTVPPGHKGVIQVNGVNKASGYYAQSQAWLDKQDHEWLITGDIGTLDEDGYLTYVGRTDDMINVGGLKVAPQEIEECLADLIDAPFAVARIPDPDNIEGFVPALFLEVDTPSNLMLDDVRWHLRSILPNFKQPRRIYQLDELPRISGTRKIRRVALTALAQQIDEQALPDIPKLIQQYSQNRSIWPAFTGLMHCSGQKLAKSICAKKISAHSALSPALALFIKATPELHLKMSKWIATWHSIFALQPKETIAIAIDSMGTVAIVSLLTLNGTRKHFFAHEQWRSLGLRLGTGVAILLSLAVSASHGFV